MGKFLERWKKEKAETKAYRDILEKKARAARRQAYASEYVRQARLAAIKKAREQAKRPSVLQRIGASLSTVQLGVSPVSYPRPRRKKGRRRVSYTKLRSPFAPSIDWGI